MKLIIALALCAVAFADDVKVVSLPNAPAPAYEVASETEGIAAIKVAKPVFDNAHAPAADQAVHFVNEIQPVSSLLVAEPVNGDEALNVRFAEAPLDNGPDGQPIDRVVVAQPKQMKFAPMKQYYDSMLR